MFNLVEIGRADAAVTGKPAAKIYAQAKPSLHVLDEQLTTAAGLLLTGFLNPDLYIFDAEALETRAEFVVRHRVPFSTLDLPEAERRRVYGDGPIEYSHTLTAQIGGQLAAGFVLTHLVEAPHQADATARYMPGYFATRAVKPPVG